MKKGYEAKKNFWIGEINKELKAGTKVEFDEEKSLLHFNGQTFEVKNLKAAIKAEWLVPDDGKYPELDGPVGETQIQEGERKRKERFAAMATQKGKTPEIVKDSKIVGCFDEERDPMSFANALGLDPNPPRKSKFIPTVIEDDTKVVTAKLNINNKDVKDLKKAMNQEPKDKKGQKTFPVFADHYDADAEIVSKYEGGKEQTLKNWETLHWTKKADVIKEASSKDFLNKLKKLENSEKIIERINNKILTL